MRQKTIKAIQVHAAADYPREACGLIAQKGRVERYFPCRNMASESNDNFVLAPADYAAVEDWGTIIGIVHSHPDATTQPSELDKAQCDATLLPGILSVGRKAIFVPSTHAENCPSLSVRSCLATMIAGGW